MSEKQRKYTTSARGRSARAVESLNALPIVVRQALGQIPVGAAVFAFVPGEDDIFEVGRETETRFNLRLLTHEQLVDVLIAAEGNQPEDARAWGDE